MKKLITATFTSCLFAMAFAQVGIGTTTPNASSVLELNSNNKAFLPPRMTSTQRDLIPNPVQGMMIFNTNTTCVEIYRGSSWFNLCTGSSSLGPVNGFYSSNEVEAASLIGYWPFDGSTNESRHNAQPVRTGGTNSFVPGVIGQAINLTNGFVTYGPGASDAGADNTTFASNDTLQNGFTLSLWAQVPDTSILSTLFAVSVAAFPNWPILGITYRRRNNGAAFDFNGGIGNVDGNGPHLTYEHAFVAGAFNDSLTWAFLAMTYTTADHSLKYYANGQLKATIITTSLPTAGNPFPNPTAPFWLVAPNYITIGAAGGTETIPGATEAVPAFMNKGLTGKIDDIRFFRKTLSTQRINDLFVLGSQGR